MLDFPLTPYESFKLWEYANQWYNSPKGGPHEFEDMISNILLNLGYVTFVRRRVHGKSCTDHEHDIIVRKKNWKSFLFIECKTGTGRIGKNDILSFYGKAIDIFNLRDKVLEIKHDHRELRFPFDDVYCLLVASVPLERVAIVCGLAFGIQIIQPYCKFEDYLCLPPIPVDYYKLEISGRDVSQNFKNTLEKLNDMTFRGLVAGQKRIFNGEKLYSIMEKYHKIITSLVE